jgi:putative DNA primase/helicase
MSAFPGEEFFAGLMRNVEPEALATAAIAYAQHGHAVFPLSPGTKVPRIKNGFLGATTDTEGVREWWSKHPHDNIGLRPDEDEFVIDVESMAGKGVDGFATLDALIEELGPLPDDAPVAETATGGRHIWLSYDGGKLVAKLGDGLDIKGHSGYLVAPPSIIKGKPYRWIVPLKGKSFEQQALEKLGFSPESMERLTGKTKPKPDAWLARVRRPEPQPRPRTPRPRTIFEGPSIIDEFCAATTWTQILGPHGWTCSSRDPEAEGACWLRPGHTSKRSASIRGGRLYVFSPNTPFEVTETGDPKGHSKFDAYAVLDHGGDTKAAITSLKPKGELMLRAIKGGESEDDSRSDTTQSDDTREETAESVAMKGCEPVWPGDIHRGQARFAYLLADREDGKLMFVFGIGWHYWDGKRWRRDDKGKARRAVLAMNRRVWNKAMGNKELQADCRKCDTAAGINGVLEIASALEPFAATVDDLDADPFLLNVANGTLDLHTLQLNPHSAVDRITKLCNGAYDPTAATPVWNAFLVKVLPDEDVRKFVQRLAGLALLGEVREHILPIFNGTGRNGKSTLYMALLDALGDYACTADPNLFMHRENAHPTGEMDLLGKRLVVVSESDQGRRLAEATMKRLTGGDLIKARAMRKDFVTFTPSHLAVMVTNHLPKVSGDDPAIWSRILVVPFDVVIPEADRDTELGAKLRLEADGILTWCVHGLRDYLAGGLAAPESVRVATDAYQARQDAVGRFIEDCCTTTPAVQATTTQLYDAWQRWAEAEGCEPLGRGHFGEALDRAGYPASKPVHGKKWRKGIRLTTLDFDGEGD